MHTKCKNSHHLATRRLHSKNVVCVFKFHLVVHMCTSALFRCIQVQKKQTDSAVWVFELREDVKKSYCPGAVQAATAGNSTKKTTRLHTDASVLFKWLKLGLLLYCYTCGERE